MRLLLDVTIALLLTVLYPHSVAIAQTETEQKDESV